MMIFRSTSSAKELDISTFSPRSTHVDLDPQAPRKSLTGNSNVELHNGCNLDPQAPRKSLTVAVGAQVDKATDLDPQAPRKSLT